MKRTNRNPGQQGFIPMIIILVMIMVGVLYVAYRRVLQVQQ